MVELPKALTTDDPAHEGYDGGAVSPDGRHIAVSYAGPRDENGTRPLIDVFDRELDGSWTRRHLTVAELGRSATWVKWLPYTDRSEEHTSELQSLMRISYAVFCLKKKKNNNKKS